MSVRLGLMLAVLVALIALKATDSAPDAASTSVVSAAPIQTATVGATAKDTASIVGQIVATSRNQVAPSTIRLPWPVGADPFLPAMPKAAEAPRPALAVALAPPMPPAPPAIPPPPPPQPPQARPQPTVFGLWRDEAALRAMMATPQGVVVAGVGDAVMGYRVQRIDANAMTLIETSSGAPLTLSLPALQPDQAVRSADGVK
jgi:hypothetical protein